MLCQQRLATILGLVLIHFLVISCATINPTADKFQLRHNGENKISEPGRYYNSNSTERGPVSVKIFEQHPRLEFLGFFNGKYWYIEKIYSDYLAAYNGCHYLGMVLAQTNQAELNFLYSVTSFAEDFSWLGARLNGVPTSFLWNDNSSPSGISIYNYDSQSAGLVLDRYPGNSGLRVTPTIFEEYYICSMDQWN